MVGERVSFIVYVFFTSAGFVCDQHNYHALHKKPFFCSRARPSAIITAYFYIRFPESRAEARIVVYLSKEERLVIVLTISADKKSARVIT